MKISLITAVASNGVIGNNGKLPWHIPEDLRRFQAITWAKPIIMGANTHRSIGRVLSNRINIVITSGDVLEGAIKVSSYDRALHRAALIPFKVKEVVVIGGNKVYEEAYKHYIDIVYLTRIYKPFRGDVKFPYWNYTHENIELPHTIIGGASTWNVKTEEIATCNPIIGNAFQYQFVTYEK